MTRKIVFLALLCLAFLPSVSQAAMPVQGGFVPPLWSLLPFGGILLSIAFFPLLAPSIWHHHYGKISFVWLVFGLIFMWFSLPADSGFAQTYGPRMFLTLEEYLSFIILLGSLFIISGGICVEGRLGGTPLLNTLLLLLGSVLASIIGTTGAAMVLIRPLLRSNAKRKHKVHLVLFFIFLVCNIGGALTPIGDPPLFLGFLQGIPFFWTLALLPLWATLLAVLLPLFFVVDHFLSEKTSASSRRQPKLQIQGKWNILLILGVVASVIWSGSVHMQTISVSFLGVLHPQNLLRDAFMVCLALLSLKITLPAVRKKNEFTYEPILEVAYLFIGIFITMIPALMLLGQRGGELGLATPKAYFWATGILSGFLDNAPTYLTFLATAMGSLGLDKAIDMTTNPEAAQILMGISAGAVFLGAMTYIGNAPNFMVKSIAEHSGIKMPSFLTYLLYSSIILLPSFWLVSYIFL